MPTFVDSFHNCQEPYQQPYIVLEWIDGDELARELTSGETKDEEQVISLLIEILEILDFVHQHKIIHRDIKPSNIIRRKKDNKLVLIDFGAAKLIGTQTSTPKSTVMIGTPGYIPPEQEQGNPDFSSDIYAVGIIGIQALTGLNPKELEKDENTGDIIWRNKAQVSPGLAQILDIMVCCNFNQRYSSAKVALQALKKLQQATGLTLVVSPGNKQKVISSGDRRLYTPSSEYTPSSDNRNENIFIGLFIIVSLLVGALITGEIYKLAQRIHFHERAVSLYEQGNVHHASNRKDKAIANYKEAIKFKPDFFDARNAMAKIFDEQNNNQAALEIYDKVLEKDQNNQDAWKGRAKILRKQGRYHDSTISLTQALKVAENQPDIWNAIGENFSSLNSDSQALPYYKRATELDKNFGLAWFNKGKTLRNLHSYEDAVKALKKATDLKPGNATAWYYLGDSLHQQKKYRQAIRAFEQAIKIKPDYQQAKNSHNKAQKDLNACGIWCNVDPYHWL
ncbi:protein kinase domain-containing protein [Mastigocoleus testarum]|uniref:serine/threonine-protein kinase n=1 Tax=Mastigocoleus testarum TaxID=996925 RepID=UPI001F203903|nr:serine/threonine-protein kinase [Mastigocoleus testarum]